MQYEVSGWDRRKIRLGDWMNGIFVYARMKLRVNRPSGKWIISLENEELN